MLNSLNYTSLGSFVHLKKEAAFGRHEETILPKENVSVVLKRLRVFACIFSFKKVKYLGFITTTHCLLFFAHLYVIKFTN